MKLRKSLLCAAALACTAPAFALDFGVMESADPIEPRAFKFHAYPLALRDDHRALYEEGAGITLGGGYGFAPGFDVEVLVASYPDTTLVGSDVEWTFLDQSQLDLSLAAGAHFGNHDLGDQRGVDLTGLASYTFLRQPALTANAAIDVAFDEIDLDRRYAGRGIDDRYATSYFVPGLQWRATRDLDLIGEVGIGLDADASDYAGFGLSYYFR